MANAINWKNEVRASESTKRVGSVREVDLLDDELRMEVYMHFFMQLPHIDHETKDRRTVLCVAVGLKCMIAAMVRSFALANSQLTTGIIYSYQPLNLTIIDNC
jgi:hypothetical protein